MINENDLNPSGEREKALGHGCASRAYAEDMIQRLRG
jgi:hypothetical protein